MRHSKPLPSMRLYCEALEEQRGAADGGAERGGVQREREREMDGEKEKKENMDGSERKGLK